MKIDWLNSYRVSSITSSKQYHAVLPIHCQYYLYYQYYLQYSTYTTTAIFSPHPPLNKLTVEDDPAVALGPVQSIPRGDLSRQGLLAHFHGREEALVVPHFFVLCLIETFVALQNISKTGF